MSAADGMTDLERLVAIEAIERLKARHDHALDTKDWATYEALHAEHHVSHDDGETRRDGAKSNAAWMAATLRDATTVHHSHSPVIVFASPCVASGIWGLEDHVFRTGPDGTRMWRQGFGFDHETYERIGGAWLFTSRSLKRHKTIVTKRPVENGDG